MHGIRQTTRRGAAVGVAVLLALSGAGAADAGPGSPLRSTGCRLLRPRG